MLMINCMQYLAKQYVYSGGRDEQAKRMFIDVIRSTEKYMVSSPKNHTQHKLLGNLRGNFELEPVMDELACFAPGTFLLAARNIDELRDIEPLAADLLDSCVLAWTSTRTGIAPEVFGWIDDKTGRHNAPIEGRTEELAKEFGVFPITKSYILRPETIESIFYFYRFTKNEIYRDMGWELFKAVQQHCRANSGFSGIVDVDAVSPKWDDREESFFFAETLKYFYLLFDDTNLLPLDEWVLNTEAHPLRIQK
ncbi:hypothetical protein INT43_000562 [Umbelopsis isabellina]|uniref:alpha-1,2-Mannosidase n=1 Tax=Mortierella isabellina TaxID=91625 RepID=A0A8H7Q1F1_MORIS|nr:hypothetical protein INT43_000562 [Umbelopsis isabellina]